MTFDPNREESLEKRYRRPPDPLFPLLILTATCALAEPTTVTLPADPPAVRTVELVEQWRIGGEDDEDVLLGVIFDGTVGPHRECLPHRPSAFPGAGHLPEGELVTTLGRPDDGPGELNNAPRPDPAR